MIGSLLATFGIVNCNRLHYARSQLKSLIASLGDDTKNCDLIFVDNASTESGTAEFLQHVEDLKDFHKVTVVKRAVRDHKNEFAAGLNTIVECAQADVIVPLQGDAQFVRRNWLRDVIACVERHDCGSVVIDAQRKITHDRAKDSQALIRVSETSFIDLTRPPLAGAGDVAYKASIIKRYYPWSTVNDAHEGGADSETKMLQKIKQDPASQSLVCYVLANPAMLTIQTDPRGTNARVRGNKRYGVYFSAPKDDLYYEINDSLSITATMTSPFSAEVVADAHPSIDWSLSRAQDGSWLKNPIRPETAVESDWTELT